MTRSTCMVYMPNHKIMIQPDECKCLLKQLKNFYFSEEKHLSRKGEGFTLKPSTYIWGTPEIFILNEMTNKMI